MAHHYPPGGADLSDLPRRGLAVIDLPNPYDIKGPMLNIATFDTKQQALDWAKEHLGADDQGRIYIVTELPPDLESV